MSFLLIQIYGESLRHSGPPDKPGVFLETCELQKEDMNPTEILHKSQDVIAQRAHHDLVLFHLETGYYFSLNELGARIWELCDAERPLEEIAEILESEYDAPRQQILDDCLTLVASLTSNGLLVSGNKNDETLV